MHRIYENLYEKILVLGLGSIDFSNACVTVYRIGIHVVFLLAGSLSSSFCLVPSLKSRRTVMGGKLFILFHRFYDE